MRQYPSKEELEQYYITENHSIKAVREHFKLGTRTFYKLLSEYGLEKPHELKVACTKKTMLERYGVEDAAHLQSAIDKRKQTNLERYGSPSPFGSKEVQKKTRQTFEETYGCHPRSTKEVQEKQKQTCLEKYGVDNVSKTEAVKQKISEKVSLANQNPAIKAKREQINLKKYGIVESGEDKSSCSGVIGLIEILDSWGVKYIANDREAIKPQEIDIYIPQLSIGIEFNGNYTHRDSNKGKNYHLNKSKRAAEQGIFIYHLFEYEWENEEIKFRILSQLRNLLGLNRRRIGARQCRVAEISAVEARAFLNSWHVQGADRAPIRLGLYLDQELVALMTFSKPRFSKQYQYELSRFCCKGDVTVNGGSAKLFKHFLKEYQPESVVSYSDNCKTRGTMYSHLGFKLDHESSPNYVWSKRHTVLTRYQCQRHKLIAKFPEYDGLSESEIMSLLGWEKISDCGNKVWTYNKLL